MKTLLEKGGVVAALLLVVGAVMWLVRDPYSDVTTDLEPHAQQLSEMAEKLREVVACQENPDAPACVPSTTPEPTIEKEETTQ